MHIITTTVIFKMLHFNNFSIKLVHYSFLNLFFISFFIRSLQNSYRLLSSLERVFAVPFSINFLGLQLRNHHTSPLKNYLCTELNLSNYCLIKSSINGRNPTRNNFAPISKFERKNSSGFFFCCIWISWTKVYLELFLLTNQMKDPHSNNRRRTTRYEDMGHYFLRKLKFVISCCKPTTRHL